MVMNEQQIPARAICLCNVVVVTPLELNQRLRSFLVLTDIYLDTSL